mmetsp:Transcript_15869/g.21116  ORF Transcript_15869/g.21116 Transcript_15869/m.21116 type:complete len:97 (-) Transcript_15869:500-790(-)
MPFHAYQLLLRAMVFCVGTVQNVAAVAARWGVLLLVLGMVQFACEGWCCSIAHQIVYNNPDEGTVAYDASLCLIRSFAPYLYTNYSDSFLAEEGRS